MLHTRGRRLSFELVKGRLWLTRWHHKQGIEGGADGLRESRGHSFIDVVKKVPQCRPHYASELTFGRPLNMQGAQAGIGTFPQVCFGRYLDGRMGAQPGSQFLLVLGRGEAEARVLPGQSQMAIMRGAVPGIIHCVVPQQLELVGDEGPHHEGDLAQLLGEISQILHGFEQDGYAVAIDLSITGVDQGALGGIQHKVFEEFLGRIRGFEARIVPFHIYLTMLGPISHTRRNRILLSQRQRCVSGVARDSNAKVPASKVKTEILALRGRINGVLSHVQFHWALMPKTGGLSFSNVPRPALPWSRRRRPVRSVLLTTSGWPLWPATTEASSHSTSLERSTAGFFYNATTQRSRHLIGITLIDGQLVGNLLI